jgi:hypothetical protein
MKNFQPTLFISHASEDKDAFVRPLAAALRRRRFVIWYDEYALTLGASLRESIDRGLSQCNYGVVVLSPAFFGKKWPRDELDGLFAREATFGRNIIFPVWHNLSHSALVEHSPTLAGRMGIRSELGVSAVAAAISKAVRDGSRAARVMEYEVKSPRGGYIKMYSIPNPPSDRPQLTEENLKELFRQLDVSARKLFDEWK